MTHNPQFVIGRIMNHAEAFVKFQPKSLTHLCGIDGKTARAHCSHLVQLGKLERVPDLSGAWYRKARDGNERPFRPKDFSK